MNCSLLLSKLPLAVAYFLAASLALKLTRYEGGVAFIWFAGALLIADLIRQPRSRWLYSVVPCMIASGLATGLFGLGWEVAPAFMVLNAAEAVSAAWLYRRYGRSGRALDSLGSLGHFLVAVAIVAPLLAAMIGAVILWTTNAGAVAGFIDIFTGHSLGNITFTPLAMMVARGGVWRRLACSSLSRLIETAALLLLMAAVSLFVFSQRQYPALFLPVLPIIVIAFRQGAAPTVIAVGLLVAIGGTATVLASGPITLIRSSFADQLQFLQFYLATTVLTALPVVADLQNRSRLHRQLRASEARFRLIADHSTDVLLHLEVNGRIRYISPSIHALSGHDAQELLGRNSLMLVAPEHVERTVDAYRAVLEAGGETLSYEYLGLSADGSARWFENQSRAILDEDGTVEGVLSIARDISERKAVELRLAAEAMTDTLTVLPNRRSFTAAVERRMSSREERETDYIALFDIDRFKGVNDGYGHDAGDAVLKTFADVLRQVTRASDSIARIGGEEFAVLLPATDIEQALQICDRLRIELAKSVTPINGQRIRVTVSGGVAELDDRGADWALKQADLALYTAKRSGRDQMALAA